MIETGKEETAERVPNRYSLVVLAAKRAKQIKEGAPPLIITESTNSLTIALEEIAAGKINYIEVPEAPDDESTIPTSVIAQTAPGPPSAMEMLAASLNEAEREASNELEQLAEASEDDSVEASTIIDETNADDEQSGNEFVGVASDPAEEE